MGSPAVNLAEYLWTDPQGWNPAYPVLKKISAAFFFNDGLRSYPNLPWLSKGYSATLGNAGMAVGMNRLGTFVKKTATGFTYLYSGSIAQGYTSAVMLGSSTGANIDLFGDGSKDWLIDSSGFLRAYFSSGVRGTGSSNLNTGAPFVVGTDNIDAASKGYVNGSQEVAFSGWGGMASVSRIGYTGNSGGGTAGLGVQAFLGFNQVLSAAEHKSLADILLRDPMELFAPLPPIDWTPASASAHFGSATGGATAGGSANLSAQVALAAVGVATAGGSAAGSVAVPLSATGLSVAGGSANPTVTVSISAAGLAQAAGTAGLAASVLLAGAGAAQASGNATLAAQLAAMASGSAQAGGSANLSGGALGSINASGGAVAGGSAVLYVTVQLAATGGAQASGSANLSGGSTTFAITASGFAQAMGSGSLSVAVQLSASGSATASGAAVLGIPGQQSAAFPTDLFYDLEPLGFALPCAVGLTSFPGILDTVDAMSFDAAAHSTHALRYQHGPAIPPNTLITVAGVNYKTISVPRRINRDELVASLVIQP